VVSEPASMLFCLAYNFTMCYQYWIKYFYLLSILNQVYSIWYCSLLFVNIVWAIFRLLWHDRNALAIILWIFVVHVLFVKTHKFDKTIFCFITILCIMIYCLILSCCNFDMGIFIKGWRLGFHFLGFSTHLEHYGSGWLVTG